MSVPLDRLYNFLHSEINRDDLHIYRFYPHGSRNLENLSVLDTLCAFSHGAHGNVVFFHDQEPLNFDLYAKITVDEVARINQYFDQLIDLGQHQLINQHLPNLNLKSKIHPTLWLRPAILVHSEMRSEQVSRYESQNYIPVYWWCHALIARDWFRYAQYDPTFKNPKTITHDFLIYNRAWTGTREYRLKFVELLLQNNIADKCLTWFQ
jgi:hypothetical protein